MHRISIYKISYCSADAAHSNVFAFIAGTAASSMYDYIGTNDTDDLTCYAFICAKRKIAHNLTITVARNFDRAYELWKKSEQRKSESKCELDRISGETLQIKSNNRHHHQHSSDLNCIQNDGRKNLLIDFNSDTIGVQTLDERQRQILHQTKWVSFDDEPQMNGNNGSGDDGDEDDDSDMQMMSGKVFANNLLHMNVNVVCS